MDAAQASCTGSAQCPVTHRRLSYTQRWLQASTAISDGRQPAHCNVSAPFQRRGLAGGHGVIRDRHFQVVRQVGPPLVAAPRTDKQRVKFDT